MAPPVLSGKLIRPVVGARFTFGGQDYVVRSGFNMDLYVPVSNILVYPGTFGVGVTVQLEGLKMDGQNSAPFLAWDTVGLAMVTIPAGSDLTVGSNTICEASGPFGNVAETVGD